MSGRGEGFIVIWDCWGVDELDRFEHMPEELPWYDEKAGAIIEIERWSSEEGGWELCEDPRHARG